MELDMLALTNKSVISHVCTRSEKIVATWFEGQQLAAVYVLRCK